MKYIRLTSLLLLLPLLLSAQEGGEIFTFLRYPVSSHVNALGGYSVSLIERDPSLIFHNPALFGGETDRMISLNYMNYVSDIHTGSAVYTQAFRERSAWGVGARFISYGSMKETDAANTVLGDFSARDLSLNVFYSYDLSERWRGGVSFGMLYSSLAEYTSFGIAVDAGLSYFDPEKGLSYGLALKNIGAQLKAYDTKREKLPWDIQLGVTKKMDHAPFRVSVTALYLNRWKFSYTDASLNETQLNDNFIQTAAKHLVFGVDFVPSENFWFGVGFNPKSNADMQLKDGGNRLGGFSAGAGLRVSGFDLNVSVARYHPSALSLMLSISTSLSDFAL
ncbi:MAG: type IX secretion system protein PorQ [Tannerella sp.]|nr:type IX secretion system protein PorQ [Tannerella sp.]